MKVHPWAAATAAFAAGTIAAVGIAQATSAPTKIPDSSTGVITACFVKKTGAVRFINAQAGKFCRSGEKQVTFSQKGPQGTTGATGASGATGPTGPSNGYVKTRASEESITEIALLGGNTVVSLDLPAGSYVVNATTSGAASNATTDEISCTLTGSPGSTVKQVASVRKYAPGGLTVDSFVPFALTGSYTFANAGAVSLVCWPDDGVAATYTGGGTMLGGSITATRVGELTVQ